MHFFINLVPLQNGRQYGNSLLLSCPGEEILQIWLAENPKIKQHHLNIIAENYHKKSNDDQNTSSGISKQTVGSSSDVELALFPSNLLEGLERFDRSHLPPSLSGEGSGLFEGVIKISEWG